MLRFDRKTFFDGYRAKFGKLDQQQVRGLDRLLSGIEQDPHIKDIRWAAYMLATVKHETAHTFQPIHEYGGKAYFVKRYGGQTRKGKELGNDTPDEGYYYAGKGDVQTTGESNYEKAEIALRREYPELVAEFERRTGKHFDLTVGDQENDETDPMNMLDPAISYAVMSYGMRHGMFTGKNLADYIKAQFCDYREARRIINGLDKADAIAKIASTFEGILRAAQAALPVGESTPLVSPIASSSPEVAPKPSVETKTTEVEQQGDKTVAQEVTVQTPKGDPPDAEPTKVSKNGPLAKWLTGGGLLTVGTFAWTYVQSNPSAVAIVAICITALILALVFRGAITDAIRMQTAADPEKKNVT